MWLKSWTGIYHFEPDNSVLSLPSLRMSFDFIIEFCNVHIHIHIHFPSILLAAHEYYSLPGLWYFYPIIYRHLTTCWPPSCQSVPPYSCDNWIALECWQSGSTTWKITPIKSDKVLFHECFSILFQDWSPPQTVMLLGSLSLQYFRAINNNWRRTALLFNFLFTIPHLNFEVSFH